MQKEAEKRVREMQSRARLVGNSEENFPMHNNKNYPKTQNNIPQNPLSQIFENNESDKLLILALLWVLWSEKADNKLLLALIYLLL